MAIFKINICIVDDDPFYSDILCKFLANKKFKVKRFSSGIEILEKLEKEPDVVFMDYDMDTMNGIQTSKILKKRWPDVNIVLISSAENADAFSSDTSKYYDSFEPKSKDLSRMFEKVKSYKIKKIVKILLTVVAFIALLIGAYQLD
jgi:DNA-binding NtrC family response regulator